MKDIFVDLAARTLQLIIGSWLAMLMLGAVHHSLDRRVPALGYWTVLVLMLVAYEVRVVTERSVNES